MPLKRRPNAALAALSKPMRASPTRRKIAFFRYPLACLSPSLGSNASKPPLGLLAKSRSVNQKGPTTEKTVPRQGGRNDVLPPQWADRPLTATPAQPSPRNGSAKHLAEDLQLLGRKDQRHIHGFIAGIDTRKALRGPEIGQGTLTIARLPQAKRT